MKVIVCGKGGCGKSTIVALLAKEMARRGIKVLALDSDESNFGLHGLLGMDKPQDFMEYFGGKKVLFEKVKTLKQGLKTEELPQSFLVKKDNIILLSMGKIYTFGEGCACPINALSSQFLENLQLDEKEFLIADTDAGVEHLGRGIEKGCDVLLAVIEPSRESIELAKRIAEMVKELKKRIYYVLNKVDDETVPVLLSSVNRRLVKACIPRHDEIFRSNLAGSEMNVRLEEIQKLADLLEN